MGYEQNLCATVLENIRDGVYVVDTDRRILSWNSAAEGITGYSRDQVRGTRCHDGILDHVDEKGVHLCHADCPLAATLRDGNVRNARVYLHHAGGYRLPVMIRTIPLRDDAGEVVGAVEVFSHHSTLFAALRRGRELCEQLNVDPLTGITSRYGLTTHLQSAIATKTDSGLRPGLLFVEVDGFSDICERHGEEAGDRVLEMVANTFQHNVRSTDHVARWDGAVFALLLEDMDEARLELMTEKMRMLVSSSYLDLPGTRLHVTVSLGATLTRPSDTVDVLVSRVCSLLELSKHSACDCSAVPA
jgi:diguanylate cyclase (GGDEF)-like protein/PAS domain S-box-containing protein